MTVSVSLAKEIFSQVAHVASALADMICPVSHPWKVGEVGHKLYKELCSEGKET